MLSSEHLGRKEVAGEDQKGASSVGIPMIKSLMFAGGAGQWRQSGLSVVWPDDRAVFKMERFIFVVEDWSRGGRPVVAVLEVKPHLCHSARVLPPVGVADHPLLQTKRPVERWDKEDLRFCDNKSLIFSFAGGARLLQEDLVHHMISTLLHPIIAEPKYITNFCCS
jgi:hypothetical protein